MQAVPLAFVLNPASVADRVTVCALEVWLAIQAVMSGMRSADRIRGASFHAGQVYKDWRRYRYYCRHCRTACGGSSE